MAYDEELAARVRAALPADLGGLMVRCDPAATEALLDRPGAARMVMREREMTGWLRVDAAHVATDDEVSAWVDIATTYAARLDQLTAPPSERVVRSEHRA